MTLAITNTDFLNGDILAGQTVDNPIIFYQSFYTIADIDAFEYVAENPAVNIWNPDTSSTWKGGTQPFPGDLTENISIDNPNNETVNYIAVAAHNMGDLPFAVTVRAYWNNGGANTLIDALNVNNNDPVIFYFDDLTADQFVVGVEIQITTQLDQPLIIGHIKAGQATVLQRREFSGVGSGYLSKHLRRTQNMSDSGQYLGQVVLSTKRMMGISQQNNTPTFVRDEIEPFIQHTQGTAQIAGGSSTSFFYAWRPTTYPDDVLYGWTMDNITPTHQSGDSFGGRMEWSVNMECLS